MGWTTQASRAGPASAGSPVGSRAATVGGMTTGPRPHTTGAELPPDLLAAGRNCGEQLRRRQETIAVGEGSCGGLISAALLAVPGASAYYVGGAVIYTHHALRGLMSGRVERPEKLQGATEPWARHLAEAARVHMGSTWGIGEGGAAGPSGNRYGDSSGHAWVAVSGPTDVARNVLTGSDDREANMVSFAVAALDLLAETLEAAPAG